jgi:hypothetical protein
MDTFLEILKLTLPALIVFLTAWLLLKKVLDQQSRVFAVFINKELEQTRAELKHKSKEIALPVRLQAYERMTLFCARIELAQLLIRTHAAGMTAPQLKNMMIATIDEEFSHNITQQMYMSDDLWNLILLAKAEAIGIIRNISTQLADTDTGQTLIEKLVEYSQTEPQIGYLQAQNGIKKEVSLLF